MPIYRVMASTYEVLLSLYGVVTSIYDVVKLIYRVAKLIFDPAIIERTIGLVLGPFTALYRSFLKRCTLTNKAVGTI